MERWFNVVTLVANKTELEYFIEKLNFAGYSSFAVFVERPFN